MIGRKWRLFTASASLLAHAVGRLLWEPSQRGELTVLHSHSPWRSNSHTGAYLRGGEDPLIRKAPFTFGRTQREGGGGRSDLSPSLENPQRFWNPAGGSVRCGGWSPKTRLLFFRGKP